MTTRKIHAIQISLRALEWLGVIVWPFQPEDGKRCCRLINSKKSWLTARAGFAVVLRLENSTEWQRYFIDSVTLYRVDRVEFNGLEVETAQGWRRIRQQTLSSVVFTCGVMPRR